MEGREDTIGNGVQTMSFVTRHATGGGSKATVSGKREEMENGEVGGTVSQPIGIKYHDVKATVLNWQRETLMQKINFVPIYKCLIGSFAL